jgi:adenosine/AMP kinase
MEIKAVDIEIPKDTNIIIGQSHFIKTVEDIHEVLVSSVPGISFGLAFCESSGLCLVRHSGNDPELEKIVSENALNVAAGHSFIIMIKNAYPINLLNAVKNVPEVCNIYCATANPVQVIIAETGMGRAILGVVDGSRTKQIEKEKDIEDRKRLLREIGYKL